MMIRKCAGCGKPRWAKGSHGTAVQPLCKPCRRKRGIQEAVKVRRRFEPKVIVPIPVTKPGKSSRTAKKLERGRR